MPRRRVAKRRRARSATQTEASTPNIGPLLDKLTVISRSLGALAFGWRPYGCQPTRSEFISFRPLDLTDTKSLAFLARLLEP